MAQAKTALQSRLDICAVRLATDRKQTLKKVAATNAGLRATVVGIYVARGAMLAGPIGAITGGATLAVLLRTNQTIALVQQGILAAAEARELFHLRCEANQYSGSFAACVPNPPLELALHREQVLFPDVKGAYVHRKRGSKLAGFRCSGGKGQATTLEITGDPKLLGDEFRDKYVE